MSDLKALKALKDKVVSQDIEDDDFYEKMDTFIKAFAELMLSKKKNNGTSQTKE